MPIDGFYQVYSLGVNQIGQVLRPLIGEFTILRVGSDGNSLFIYLNAETGATVELKGSGAQNQYIWKNPENAVNPDWIANARYLTFPGSTDELLVGWVMRGTVKDCFVAIKGENDPDLLTIPAGYTMYYKSNAQTDLTITKEGDHLELSFGGGCARAHVSQTPGRFNANKQTGDYSLIGFRLPRFIKANGGKYAVIVGHRIKGAIGGDTYDPMIDPEDIEPFVAVSTGPVESGPC